MTGPPARRRLSPPAITLVALALFLGVAALLGLSASTGSAGSEQLTKSVPWLVWRVVAALALVVFLALFLSAPRIPRNGPLLRNPLTALSIFVPLITAALAAFLPQLGTG